MLGLTQIIFWDFYFLLFKARMEVEDLFVDLADGKKLLKLLEIISGEKLSKPNNGRMRVHKIENVNKSLAFLHTKVYSVIRKITKKILSFIHLFRFTLKQYHWSDPFWWYVIAISSFQTQLS